MLVKVIQPVLQFGKSFLTGTFLGGLLCWLIALLMLGFSMVNGQQIFFSVRNLMFLKIYSGSAGFGLELGPGVPLLALGFGLLIAIVFQTLRRPVQQA